MPMRAPKYLVVALLAGAVSLGACSSGETEGEGDAVLITGQRDKASPEETTTTTTEASTTTTTLYWDASKELPPVDADGNVIAN